MIEPTTLAGILDAQFEYFLVLPDSRTQPLIQVLHDTTGRRVIQATDEATAVGIAAGLTVASRSCLLVMESSGLRRSFEAIGRLSGSHGIHPIVLATDRGALGDADWWAAMHQPMARHVAAAIGARTAYLAPTMSTGDVERTVADARRHLRAQQCPVILWLHPQALVTW